MFQSLLILPLSTWARSAWTAGLLLVFSMRIWIYVLSVFNGHLTAKASISRTRCPLPGPPMLGLHGINPMVSKLMHKTRVFNPSLAAAKAASTPAWPAANDDNLKRIVCFIGCFHFPTQKLLNIEFRNIISCNLASNFAKRVGSFLNINWRMSSGTEKTLLTQEERLLTAESNRRRCRKG